jgi:hypothetical protein
MQSKHRAVISSPTTSLKETGEGSSMIKQEGMVIFFDKFVSLAGPVNQEPFYAKN